MMEQELEQPTPTGVPPGTRTPNEVPSAKGKQVKENTMREIKIEKLVLNIGGVAEKLEKGKILLEKMSGKKAIKIKALKRIPNWGVRPGLEVGVKVTLRGKEAEDLLRKMLPAINNTLKEKQIRENFISFGIPEYIEIPDVEYIREVGIMGFEVTVVFRRAGKRVEKKKIKRGKVKKTKQNVSPKEIGQIMEDKFQVNIVRRHKHDSE